MDPPGPANPDYLFDSLKWVTHSGDAVLTPYNFSDIFCCVYLIPANRRRGGVVGIAEAGVIADNTLSEGWIETPVTT